MNQLSKTFNYSLLDDETASLLRSKEDRMREVVGKAYTDLGKELKDAQDELSKRGYGCFYEWFESLGFKKDQVYRWIGRYELIVANCDKRELIEELPLSLTYEISKPSIEPDLKQKVLDGEIESLKELREVKKALQESQRAKEEAEKLAEQAKNEARHWQGVAKSQPVRVETKTIEVIPESVKRKLEKLEFDNNDLRHGYKSAKEKLQQFEISNTVDFDEEQARKQREKIQHEADYNTLELRVHITNFMEKVAITSYLKGAIASSDPVTKKRLMESIDMLESFVEEIKSALNGRILGGVVNE